MNPSLADRQGALRPWQWLVLAALLGYLYHEILPLWGRNLWDDPNYSHGLLLPLVSLYLLNERRRELRAAERRPWWPGVVVVVGGLLLLIAGTVAAEFFSKRVSLIVVVFGLVLFLEGRRVARILALPIGLLLFAVPLPYVLYNAVAFPLKFIATDIAVFLLELMGMPVFKEGNVITLPHTTLEVVDACSGIRSLMTMFTLAFLLGALHQKKWWKAVLIFLLAAPMAVLANGMRVTATGVLTRYNPAWGAGTVHELTGWLFFIAAFGLLLLCSKWLRGRDGL